MFHHGVARDQACSGWLWKLGLGIIEIHFPNLGDGLVRDGTEKKWASKQALRVGRC